MASGTGRRSSHRSVRPDRSTRHRRVGATGARSHRSARDQQRDEQSEHPDPSVIPAGPPMRVFPVLVSLDGYLVGGGEIDTQPERYVTGPENSDHPVERRSARVSTARVMTLSALTVLAVWTGDVAVALVTWGVIAADLPLGGARGGTRAAVGHRPGAGGSGMDRARAGCARGVPGWARVVDDPQPYPGSTRVILGIERFEFWSRGRAQQLRVQGGEGVSGSR